MIRTLILGNLFAVALSIVIMTLFPAFSLLPAYKIIMFGISIAVLPALYQLTLNSLYKDMGLKK